MIPDDEQTTPSLWDELLGDTDGRRPAEPTPKMVPGYYDELPYMAQDEGDFGLAEYEAELREIRRLKALKFQQENNNNE